MVVALVIMLVAVTGTFWLISWYRELPPRPPGYEILYRRLLRKLARLGIEKKPSEDSRAFLQRISSQPIPSQQLAQADQLARIIDLYNHIKYGRHGDSTLLLKLMRSMIKSLQT